MVFFIFVAAVSLLILVWIRKVSPRSGLRRTVLLPAAVLSIVRVSFVWLGSHLLKDGGSDWQIVGYAMLIFTLPEAIVVRALRNQEALWRVALSVLVVAGSILWVATMAALAIALRRWSSPELS